MVTTLNTGYIYTARKKKQKKGADPKADPDFIR